MLSGLSFRSALVFSINSLILSDLPLTSFHLVEASLSAFCGFILLRVQLFKIIYNCSYFRYSFSNQSVLLAQLENVSKLWNNNRTVHVTEQNQNQVTGHVQVDHVFYCSI